jgi:hypothetical protein
MNMNIGQAKGLTRIRIYWDERDYSKIGWTFIGYGSCGHEDTGMLDRSLTLDDAIDEACFALGVKLTHDDFAKCQDGGSWAEWCSVVPAVLYGEL